MILPFNDTSLALKDTFDPFLGTKFITHGFQDTIDNASWTMAMKNRWLDYDNLNVVLVDWKVGASAPYPEAVLNTRVVGALVASQIQYLVETYADLGLAYDSFHLLGHSLGAHVFGFAGKALEGRLGQITGLDPAGPLFEFLPPQVRLWRSDAVFVDVLHTDGLVQGTIQPCGHVDFYPNGGREFNSPKNYNF